MSHSTDSEDHIAVLIALILAIPMLIYKAFALSMFWSWFMVAKFSAPEISVATFIGLLLFKSLITKNDFTKDLSGKDSLKQSVGWIVATSMALVMGLVVKGYA